MREGYINWDCLAWGERRLQGDLIEENKIMHSVEKVDRETFFSLSHNTRIWVIP